MKNLYIFLFLGLSCVLGACSDDEDTTPSMADVDRLEGLIDTSNSDIMDFKEKYGTYILYDFDHILDFAYQFEEATSWRNAEITRLEKEDATDAVRFLKENFFNCYTDDIIKNYFPRKLLICSKIYGTTLGVSESKGKNYHDAVANLNSMTIAGLDKASLDGLTEETKDAYLRQLHFIYLAGYLVNARTFYYLDDAFFEYSGTLYSSLMDPNRKPARDMPDEFFYQKGFFRVPDSDTYFGTADEDLIQFTKHLILMDKDMFKTLVQYEVMKRKMQIAAQGLQSLGVKLEEINEYAARFLDETVSSNPPVVEFTGESTIANIKLKDNPTYTLPVSVKSDVGLRSVVVKDAEGKVWFEQTEFDNPNEVAGIVLDLTSLTETSALNFTVTAEDMDDNITSSLTYTLNVSVSQMNVTFDQEIKSYSDIVCFNLAIESGVKRLAKIEVGLNGTLKYEIDLAAEADADKVEKALVVAGLLAGDNVIDVAVYEEGMTAPSYKAQAKAQVLSMKSTSKTRTLVNLADLKYGFNVKHLAKPAVNEYGQSAMIFASFEGIEDKNNLIDPDFGIYDYLETPKRHTWYLVYEGNKVVKIVDRMRETVISDGFPDYIYQDHTYEFVYNGNEELVKATLDGADLVTDVVYENGLMASYKFQGSEVRPQYATAPQGTEWQGSVVRVDCADASDKAFVFSGNELANPFYVQGLPDVIPGEMLGFPIRLSNTPYLFNEIGAQKDIWTETDEVIGTFTKDGKECQYRFKY